MSKLHGLNHLTGVLDDSDPAYLAPAFYQPEILGTSSGTVPTPAVLTQTLYLTEKGDASAISVDDINQGQMGDCFLLSPIGEIVLQKQQFISSMIHVNTNGSETVTLYEASNGRLPGFGTTAFKAVGVTVTNVFPNYSVNNGATQDVLGSQKEIWPQVIEKAVATLGGGYAAIANGGNPAIAMEELTGHAANPMSPASLTLAALQNFIKADDMIVMDTLSGGSLPAGLFANHAYMFEGLTGTGASAMVHLGNPWGFDQPAPMLLSQLSHGFAEVDVGHLS